MAPTPKMVASEILMCGVNGLKQIPILGEMAVHVVEGLQKRHEAMGNAAQLAEFEAKLSRVERGMRDTVEREIRTILANLGRPAVPGPESTREMSELREIYEQGWAPNLFEGILRNSSHWQELRKNPKTFGRILSDHEPLDPDSLHLLIDKDYTRVLQMPVSSLAVLLGNQKLGVPLADMRAAQDIWAFPSAEVAPRNRAVVQPSPPTSYVAETTEARTERVLFDGLVLCWNFSNHKHYNESDYSRCKTTVTNNGITLQFASGITSKVSVEDLHYAKIRYDDHREKTGVPPAFNKGARIELEVWTFDFLVKSADWEKTL